MVLTSVDLQPIRHYALHKSSNRFDKVHLINTDLDTTNWRFELTIVDNPYKPGSRQIPSAIFLIPGGRETEFLFSSRQGLISVAESANCLRLIAVSLNRYHTYPDSAEAIQAEITSECELLPKLAAYVPPNIDKSDTVDHQGQIPFMAIAGIGTRMIIAEGNSQSTGPYIVEQCETTVDFPPETVQVVRLYFQHSPQLIQSEAILLEDGSGINHLRMSFEHNWYFAAGTLLRYKPSKPQSHEINNRKSLVIGLGGGSLLNFLTIFHPNMDHNAIELDPSVIDIAKAHFGYCEGEHMNTYIGDGLSIRCSNTLDCSTIDEGIIFQAASIAFIAIDVDSKDHTVGMSCPPLPFIDTSYLDELSRILCDDGILAINVSARNPLMLDTVIENLQCVFGTILIGGNEEDKDINSTNESALNVVVFAMKDHDYKLPKRMNLVDMLHEHCDNVSLHNGNVRGQLEDCLASIHIYTGNDINSKVNNEVNCKAKKKSSSKKKKRR